MKTKQDKNFWLAYSDLMTSLFFIMLVLFVFSFFLYRSNIDKNKDIRVKLTDTVRFYKQLDSIRLVEHQNKVDRIQKQFADSLHKYKVSKQEQEAIKKLAKAFKKLDKKWFTYLPECNRINLNVDIEFEENQYDINAEYISPYTRKQLIEAGKVLLGLVDSLSKEDKIKYLLIIEGRSGKFENESYNIRYGGSTKYLSYARAKALFDFWKQHDIVFDEKLIEVILAGSGFEGKCRYKNEAKNRTFVIQIVPKTDVVYW